MQPTFYLVKDPCGNIVGRLMIENSGGYLTMEQYVGVFTVEPKPDNESWKTTNERRRDA